MKMIEHDHFICHFYCYFSVFVGIIGINGIGSHTSYPYIHELLLYTDTSPSALYPH